MAHVIDGDGEDVPLGVAAPEASGWPPASSAAVGSTTISTGAATLVMTNAAQRLIDVNLPRLEIVRVAEMATAAVRASIGTARELVRTQNLLRTQIAAPIQEMLRTQNVLAQAIAPTQELLRRSIGLSGWWVEQNALFRSPLGTLPSSWFGGSGWWNAIDLWPTDALMTSVLRPLDVLRPQLLDFSRALDNVAGVTRWIGQLNRGLWGDLCLFGQRIAYWAVCEARAAMDRWDVAELAEFVDIWLDAGPTEARIEALVEALLQIDISRYTAEDGRELLQDLRKKVAELARARRREHGSLLGMRRGVGPITSILDAGSTVLHPVGTRGGRSLEDTVLDDLQPDVDPRIIEMINELGPQDRKIAMMKTATGCSWAAAATASGAPALRGEALRRRLHRHRDALAPGVDPLSQDAAVRSAAQLGAAGRLRPAVVHVDRATGIWP